MHARQGRLTEAQAWLPLPGTSDEQDVPTLAANLAWISGTVLLALGRPAQARSLVEDCLAQLQAAAHPPSPLNATQLYRVLSEACEALGDLRASLDALKRSQASCFTWVGQSVQSRLQALHLAQGGAPAGEERHARRMQALDEALVQARDGASPEPALRSSSFLAHVTHEMRNPLQGVIGMTSLLMMSDLDARQSQHLRLAHSSAQMLLSLCNDVLDLAKIEAGRFELRPASVDVGEAVREAAGVFEAQSQAGGVPLLVKVDPTLPSRLLCDRLRLQQLCMNLIGNAVKFTEQGEVEVRVGWRGGELHVAVRDTGPGLSPAEVTDLFQEFVQAGAGAAHGLGGTGLGLALCRSLVVRMGGRIGVDSTPGRGSTFWFVLPLAPGG